jgi:murein DD-endopeptidase MepM/ murein hydrolase activator NlpD
MKKRYKIPLVIIGLFFFGFLLPEPRHMPVAKATGNDWNINSFWYEPWGSSGVHKGVDIFAKKGAPVIASTHLLILYKGHIKKGGNIVVGLGPKWRIHYFAHLDTIDSSRGIFVNAGGQLGTVGDTGNAQGKQAHLHYSIVSLVPLPWRVDNSTQGHKKVFYLDPSEYLASK